MQVTFLSVIEISSVHQKTDFRAWDVTDAKPLFSSHVLNQETQLGDLSVDDLSAERGLANKRTLKSQ